MRISHFGKTLPEFPQHRRQDVLARPSCSPPTRQPAVPHFESEIEARPRRLHLTEDFFRVPEKLFARLCQHHALAHAVQQPAAEILLQPP